MRLLEAALGAFLFFAVVLSFSCSRVVTPATEVIYQGDIEGDYKSSDDVLAQVLAVKDCMGLTDRSFPLPQITGMSGGNGVQCGDQVKLGCYTPGMIIVPNDVEVDIIAHEAVHHYLYLSTGDLDAAHKSDWFLKCGGPIKTE